MPDLIATPPLALVPLSRGGVTLLAWDFGPMFSVAPLPGDAAPCPVGCWVEEGGRRVVWTGRAQWFVMGSAPEGGAVTDQSDGWAGLRLTGATAGDVLMRLVALDLRLSAFPVGSAARAGLNHMPMVLLREHGGFALLVFRSMALAAWHEIAGAMARVEARALVAARG